MAVNLIDHREYRYDLGRWVRPPRLDETHWETVTVPRLAEYLPKGVSDGV